MKNTEYKKCDKCCYDILDDDGNVMEHYCIDEDGHGYYGDEQERELEEIKRIDNESKR